MKSEILVVQPKLRVYTVQITYIILGLLSLLVMFANLPKNGIFIFQILDIRDPWLRAQLVTLLRYKLSYTFLAYSIYASAAVLLMSLSFYWLKAKTTSITLTNKFMRIAYGIISKEEDNVDMVDVRDQSLRQSIIQRIIGSCTINVISNDKSIPNIFLLLTKPDAHQVYEFLQIHSTRSIVDYRMSQDMSGASDKIGVPFTVDEKPDKKSEDSDSDPKS